MLIMQSDFTQCSDSSGADVPHADAGCADAGAAADGDDHADRHAVPIHPEPGDLPAEPRHGFPG